MTADVNVTEKVARAEAKRREPLQWRESVEWRDGFVAGVLWHFERLAAPEVLAGIAGVLHDAHWRETGDSGLTLTAPACPRCSGQAAAVVERLAGGAR